MSLTKGTLYSKYVKSQFKFLKLRNRAMPMEGRGLHSKGLTEDTLSVLRDGGNNGNEISKNS